MQHLGLTTTGANKTERYAILVDERISLGFDALMLSKTLFSGIQTFRVTFFFELVINTIVLFK